MMAFSVGYRYFSTFQVEPAYAFGYGLSYSNFTMSDLHTSSASFEKQQNVRVKVKNTGKVAGKEVVQLYLSAPSKFMDKPIKELKAFKKTKMLQPGESQIVYFTLNASDLASFDSNRSAWVAEAGEYEIQVGNSSDNVKQEKSFDLKQELVVEKVHAVLAPTEQLVELKK